MPSNPWATDLERVKRELSTRIDRLSTDHDNAQRNRGPDPETTRRLDAVERRAQTTIDQTNRTLSNAHAEDERLGTRIDSVERRVQTTVDQTNRTFGSAHTETERLSGRLDQLERRIAELARNVERAQRSN